MRKFFFILIIFYKTSLFSIIIDSVNHGITFNIPITNELYLSGNIILNFTYDGLGTGTISGSTSGSTIDWFANETGVSKKIVAKISPLFSSLELVPTVTSGSPSNVVNPLVLSTSDQNLIIDFSTETGSANLTYDSTIDIADYADFLDLIFVTYTIVNN